MLLIRRVGSPWDRYWGPAIVLDYDGRNLPPGFNGRVDETEAVGPGFNSYRNSDFVAQSVFHTPNDSSFPHRGAARGFPHSHKAR